MSDHSADLDHQADSQAGKSRPGRLRAACTNCRQNKQKCDSGERHPLPCRRCELYGLECKIETKTGPLAAPRATPPAKSPSAPMGAKESSAVASALRELTERLARIEVGIQNERRARGVSSSPGDDSVLTYDSVASPGPMPELVAGIDSSVEANPLSIINDTIDQVDILEASSSPPGLGRSPQSPQSPYITAAINPLDAIARGLLTASDAQASFNFFRERIEPWVWTPPDDTDSSAVAVQRRSPLLYHVILLATAYFNTSETARSQETYLSLTTIVNELLGHQIMCPDPSHVNSDTARALGILLLYRPIQFAAYSARGMVDAARVEQASKVNTVAAGMIHALVNQTARFLSLSDAPAIFTRALINGQRPELGNLRLWYRILADDVHGSLQGGIPTSLDPADALRTTRQLAALRRHPRDVRHAALVELYAIMRAPPNARPGESRFHDIPRVNALLDRWEDEWRPQLAEAQVSGDPLAYTVLQCLRQFCTVTVNSPVFHRWRAQRQKSLDAGGDGRPKLTDSDWMHLQKAADAAQKTIFALSLESSGNPLRSQRWPETETTNSFREALHLDPGVVETYRTGPDTMSCVMFVYPILFLVRMGSAGLISCELLCRRNDYEAGCDLNVPQPLRMGAKLPRLIELASNFLDGVAARPTHPAKKHSQLLQMILRAGLGENTPAISPPPNLLPTTPPAPIPAPGTWLWDLSVTSTQPPTMLPPSQFKSTSDSVAPTPGQAMNQLLQDVPFLYSAYNEPQYSGALDSNGLDMDLSSVDWDALQNGTGWEALALGT